MTSDRPIATSHRPRRVWLAVLAIALCGGIAWVAAGARTPPGRDHPMFHDPMADVQVEGAARIDRDVTRPRDQGGFISKPKLARVTQTYQATSPAEAVAVRDRLVAMARAAGWSMEIVPSRDDVITGSKVIDREQVKISARVLNDYEPNQVLLSIR